MQGPAELGRASFVDRSPHASLSSMPTNHRPN